ncbi:MAG: Na/Pi cotransporter family protein [Clostridiaceae bacterium]|nr:Na/Pi cotransporter family protein [Clostridiaceae bacterium]
MSSEVVSMIFCLLGGLAVFIYGMNLMSDGLQKAAGERMRRILEVLTGNPIIAVLVGALVTTLIQSSSATTVMVIGFVSARLMTLNQAIGVILGANIGTTVTAQLVAFNIGHYAYPIAALGFILFFFFKRNLVKYIGQTIFAFGLLFMGLNIMSDAMAPLAESQSFALMMARLSEYPILGLIIGTLFTLLIQSSSATIAVLQNLAKQTGSDGKALISLTTALPMLYGTNIGTTITALLASIGARISAKRAAVAHSVFNIVGSIIFMFFIPTFAWFIQKISPGGNEAEVISRQIANAHTSFNLINTLLWLPFIWLLAKIVTFLVRGKEDDIEKRVLYLDYKVLSNPAIAMDLATRELTRMAAFVRQMMADSKKAFTEANMELAKNVLEIEELVDILQDEIVKYLSTMLSEATLTERQSIRLSGLMHIANDIERMGDHCKNVVEFAMQKENEKIPFSKEAITDVSETFSVLNQMVDDAIHSLQDENIELAKKVLYEENEVDNLENKLRVRHLERLNSGLCNPKSTVIFIELIHNLERIGDHCNNIAEAILHDKENRPLHNDPQSV